MWNMGRRFETLTVYLTGVTAPLEKALKRATSYIGKFKSVVTSGAGMLGVGLGFTALIAGAKRLIDTMDGIGKAAGNLGIATEEYQKLSYAARRTNTPMQMVEMAMMKARKMSGDLAVGNAEAAKTFGALGLRLQDLQGLKTDELFGRIATALNYVKDPLERSAIQAKLFGESGEKLNNFLRDYNALGREAAARGMIIKDDKIKAAEALKDGIENLNSAIASLAANTGFVSWLNRVAEGIDAIATNSKKMEKIGLYDLPRALEYSIEYAEKSGKYTPEQIQDMKSVQRDYGLKIGASIFSEDEYKLLDKALKEAGFGMLARTRGWRFAANAVNDQFEGSAEFTTGIIPPEVQAEQRRKAREEAKKAEEERQRLEKNRAEMAAEAAAKAAQELKDKNNKTLETLVQSAERDVRIDTLKQSGNTVEAELQRRLGGLYGNKDLDPHLFDRLQKALETQITAEEKAAKAAKDRQKKENQERREKYLEDSFNNTVRDLNQRAEIDRLRREGKTLDADLLERVYSFRNQGKILTDNQVAAMREALEKVQTPTTVAVAEQRSAITAALQGSLEAYRARVNQGNNIPDQQLKVQQQQLSEQKKTNQLLENNKTTGTTLEVAAIGGV